MQRLLGSLLGPIGTSHRDLTLHHDQRNAALYGASSRGTSRGCGVAGGAPHRLLSLLSRGGHLHPLDLHTQLRHQSLCLQRKAIAVQTGLSAIGALDVAVVDGVGRTLHGDVVGVAALLGPEHRPQVPFPQHQHGAHCIAIFKGLVVSGPCEQRAVHAEADVQVVAALPLLLCGELICQHQALLYDFPVF